MHSRCPTVKLYLDDVEEIIRVLNPSEDEARAIYEEHRNYFGMDEFDYEGFVSENVLIADKDCIYDSILELKEKKGEVIKELVIESQFPYVSFSINGGLTGETRIWSPENTHKAKAAISDIERILKSRTTWLRLVANDAAVFFLIILGVAGCSLPTFNPSLWPMGGFVLVLAFLVGYVASKSRIGCFSKVLLVRKHEEEGFLKRNKDKIILAAITIVLTLLARWGCDRFTSATPEVPKETEAHGPRS